MEFESLIFDVDGTLWDTRALVAEGYNVNLRREGLDHLCVCGEDLSALFGKTRGELADALFASLPQPEREPLMIRCMEEENRYLKTQECRVGFPNVRQTMEQLAKKYRLFLVSNCEQCYPEICMEKMGIGHLIRGHLCYGDTLTPKGETIRTLMARHGIRSACYIGDTQGDRNAAAFAEIPFVYCSYGFGQVDGYWKKIEAFEELLTFL